METVKIGNTELTLQDGTMFRFDNEPPYYCDVGVTNNGNRVLFYYTDASEVVDYIGTIIKKIPDFAMNFVDKILTEHENILVRCYYVPGSVSSCYEIYCDYDGTNDILEIVDWIREHNDWAEVEKRFTYVVEGKQRCIGE